MQRTKVNTKSKNTLVPFIMLCQHVGITVKPVLNGQTGDPQEVAA